MADDIFYERFPPEDLKGAAPPRIWYEDGAYMVGMKGKAWTGGDFGRVLMQYDDLAGAATNNIAARIRELREDGIDRELAFPNAVLALFHYPDKGIRERVFRIYNEVMAELQESSDGHFYGVGLINWWDPAGTRSTLEQLKSLGLKTFLLPLNPPGKDDEATSTTTAAPRWTPSGTRSRPPVCRSAITSARRHPRRPARTTASSSA